MINKDLVNQENTNIQAILEKNKKILNSWLQKEYFYI